jgi:hypothetical protein
VEPGQDQEAVDLLADREEQEDSEVTSEVEVEGEEDNEAPDENVEDRSVLASDAQGEEGPIKVVEVREFDEDIYFVVSFGSKLKMMARKYMRKYFPLELIAFYESHITSDPITL